jgi:hypothetical protein
MHRGRSLAKWLGLALVAALAVRAEAKDPGSTQPVSPSDAQRWVRWVIPGPREVRLSQKAVVPAARLAITVAPRSPLLVRRAAEELAEAINKQTGVEVPISNSRPQNATLEILLGTCASDGRLGGIAVPGAERLAKLPCAEQAYRIVPLDGRTLALVGTHPVGVYYAGKTLKQLLAAPLSRGPTPATLAIPLADVTDWPDLAERGLWGGGGDGNADEDIQWLAERKMNLLETHATLALDNDGHGVATYDEQQLARAERNAVHLIPIIHHLEQLPPAIFARWPELRAVGDPQAWRRVGNIYPACFSQPKMVELLGDWLECLARYRTVNAVNIWLAENDVPCLCEKCKAANNMLLQTQAALRAWQRAKRVKPGLRLRILLTQGSYRVNAEILAAVPPEVEVIYYDGSRTYNASREPMIYPLLEDYTARGRWLGCYPQLMASWRLVCPWSGPQFIKTLMSEFVDKRLRSSCAYTAPTNRFYEFNVTAAAEWSWNAHGRSEREFSAAWATRQGRSDPEKAADWAVTLGPVGWDVYGANIPMMWLYGNAGGPIRSGRRPALGTGVFKYFPTPAHFDEDLAACERAMQLARQLQAPTLVEETRTIRGLVEVLKGMYVIADAAAVKKPLPADRQQRAAGGLALVERGSRVAHDGLLAWGAALAAEFGSPTLNHQRYFLDTVNSVDGAMTDVSDAAADLGLFDPGRVYRATRVGTWTTDDFAAGPTLRKTWDVTRRVTEAGRYQVTFRHDSGGQGAAIQRVALASAPRANPAQTSELSSDAHPGITGRVPKNAAYEVVLKHFDPQRRYFLVVDLEGIARNAPPDRSRCEGHAELCKLRAADAQTVALRNKSWTWGYVIEGPLPGKVPFISQSGRPPFDGTSSCSLETGADWLGTPNVIYMNSNHNRNTLIADCLDRLARCRQVICALQHGQYADTARRVSEISKQYPKIIGALIDDFRERTGPSKAITPDETRTIYQALKSANPSLRLWLVRYTWQDQKELIPFLPYFDAINLWVWVAEEKPWRETIDAEIERIRAITHKPILLGLFIHDYGRTGKAVPMSVLELQTRKAAELTHAGRIEGFVILQNGWFDHLEHREQVQWLRQYLDGPDAAR